MTLEEKAEEWLQSVEGDDCVVIIDREERKQAYIAGAKELTDENNKLLDVINNQDVKIADLEKRIEKMKCCDNCCHCGTNYDCDYCSDHFEDMPDWELKE